MRNAVRILIVTYFMLSGCYFRASINPIQSADSTSDTITAPLSENREFVSGAQKTSSLVRSYQKSSTIGHHQAPMVKSSLSRNYKLYVTVQGQIISSGK